MISSDEIIQIQLDELAKRQTHYQRKIKILRDRYEEEYDLPEMEECVAAISETLDMVSDALHMIENTGCFFGVGAHD